MKTKLMCSVGVGFSLRRSVASRLTNVQTGQVLERPSVPPDGTPVAEHSATTAGVSAHSDGEERGGCKLGSPHSRVTDELKALRRVASACQKIYIYLNPKNKWRFKIAKSWDWSSCFTNSGGRKALERVKWEGAGRGL